MSFSIAFFFTLFLEICAPIFVVVALGWFLDRKFRLNLDTMVKMNFYAMVPAFIFAKVVTSELSGVEAFNIVVFVWASIAVMFVLSVLVGRFLKLSTARQKALNISTMFYNCGNYGLPLVTLAFGHEAASVQVYVIATMNVSMFTLGLMMSQHTSEAAERIPWRSFGKVLRQPAIYALLLGLICQRFELPVQEVMWIWQPIDLLQAGLIGFALLTLGVQMSQTKPEPFKAPLWSGLIVRLIGGPISAFILAQLFHFNPAVTASLVLAVSAPTAVNTALLAYEFKGDVSYATSAVYYSTLFSMLTTTITLILLKGWLAS